MCPVEIEASAIAAYERLVFSVANELYASLHPDSMTIEDFVQEGMIGLLTAIQHKKETGDPRPLMTFAYVHIRMAILDAYRTQDHMIRLPVSLFRKDANVTPEELARVKSLARHLSIESYAERRDGAPLVTHRRVSSASPVERVVLAQERMEELLRGLMRLPELQRSLLVSHFGVVGEPIPMLHLSRQTGIAPSSLFRLVHAALDQMHQSLYTDDA